MTSYEPKNLKSHAKLLDINMQTLCQKKKKNANTNLIMQSYVNAIIHRSHFF